MYAWSFHVWLIEVRGSTLIFYKDDIPQSFKDFFHRNYDPLLDMWSAYRFEDLNNYIFTETERITLEFSKKTAFDHALECSTRGAERVNFAPIAKKTYSWSDLLRLSLACLLPERMIRAKNELVDRLNRHRPNELSQEMLGILICQRCRARELQFANGSVKCRCCSAKYEQSEGIFDFDV